MSGRSTVVATRDGARLEFDRARLLVESGPDRGTELVLADRAVVIGRDEEADLRLTDPGVSRLHARVSPDEDGWRLRDLGSAGGTRISGTPVEVARLVPDSVFEIGTTTIRFRVRRAEVRTPLLDEGGFEGLLGESLAMRRLFGVVSRVAGLELPVLLHGESGTGKESLARAVHAAGPRPEGPFETVDCTLLEREHLRSELFGHVKGAYTGAETARKGAFERAHGGTLFLDEIGELPLEIQPVLLRVLEEGEVRPLGSDRAQRVRVRVVAATHRDLPEMVAAGGFRRDLYYRISALTVDVPPLREREGDHAVLARAFLPPDRELSAEALERLASHPWPGNVRELRNVVQRAAALSETRLVGPETIRLDPLPSAGSGAAAPVAPGTPGMATPSQARTGVDPELARALAEATGDQDEAAVLRRAIELCRGNRKAAAARLGIGRSTFYRRLERLGISADPDEG